MILTLFACSCFAVLFSKVSGLVQSFKHFAGIKRIKPYDCEKCMGFWTGMIVFNYQYWNELAANQWQYFFIIIGLASISSLLSIIIYSIIKWITAGSGFTNKQREEIARVYLKVYGGKEPDMFCDECVEETFRRVMIAAEDSKANY